MELRGDDFFQKAIHTLARSLSKLNPTPDDKVKHEKNKIFKH